MRENLLTETGKALVELLNTTSRVHDPLLTCVEGVRCVGDFNVNDWVFIAISPRSGFRAGKCRAGKERLARSKVVKNDRRINGVNVRLHGFPSIGTLALTMREKQKIRFFISRTSRLSILSET